MPKLASNVQTTVYNLYKCLLKQWNKLLEYKAHMILQMRAKLKNVSELNAKEIDWSFDRLSGIRTV